MLKTGVTIGCAAFMVVAAVLAIRLRSTQRMPPSPLTGEEAFGERLAVTTGRVGGMLVGALLSGILTVGAGGRLLMRVLASTSSDGVQGRLTEADAVIGKVTVGGSVFIVVFIGMGAGVAGLALYPALRRWLPRRSTAAGVVGVAIGAGLLLRPSGLLSSSNSDFSLLGPVPLAVAIVLTTLVLFGATFGVLVDHLAPRWPRPGKSARGVMSLAPFALIVVAPPLAAAVLIGVFAGASTPRLKLTPAQDRAGHVIVMALGALGSLSILTAAASVLAS